MSETSKHEHEPQLCTNSRKNTHTSTGNTIFSCTIKGASHMGSMSGLRSTGLTGSNKEQSQVRFTFFTLKTPT